MVKDRLWVSGLIHFSEDNGIVTIHWTPVCYLNMAGLCWWWSAGKETWPFRHRRLAGPVRNRDRKIFICFFIIIIIFKK